MSRKREASGWPVRAAACVLVAVCLVLGVIGLILPVIPGLLLLVIAAWLAARQFPVLERRLRRHPTVGAYLDRADSFVELSPGSKLKVGALLCVKLLLDGVALVGAVASRLARGVAGRHGAARSG